MVFNGIIGANCISKMFRDRLFDNIKEGAENDLQLSVLLDTLEKLPDCSKLMEEGNKPLEPGKKITNNGELVDMPKKQRKLSEYQLFVQKCAKGTGKSFKECIVEWREFKKNDQKNQ